MKLTKSILLSTVDLSVGFLSKRDKHILFEQLNLSLHSGELICFMGPNGIGKSSLIRTLANLQIPISGTIRLTPDEGKLNSPMQIAVVLTDKIVNSNLTGYDLITFGRYPYLDWSIRLQEGDKQIIEQSIRQVNVQDIVEKKINELSDGQLQMIMIARALAQDTPIILLDEPTAHLDLNNRVEIMKLLRQLARSTNKGILVSTHELDLALQMADGIWLAGRNRNILTGLPEDLVLDGSFDAIFKFKGFDLKTGKIQHESTRGVSIELQGEGYELLWTKNALERNGFTVVTTERLTNCIRVSRESSTLYWTVSTPTAQKRLTSLLEVLNYLNQTIAYGVA